MIQNKSTKINFKFSKKLNMKEEENLVNLTKYGKFQKPEKISVNPLRNQTKRRRRSNKVILLPFKKPVNPQSLKTSCHK